MEVEIEYIAMAGSSSNAPKDWQRDMKGMTISEGLAVERT
jgi:hypothetical protein